MTSPADTKAPEREWKLLPCAAERSVTFKQRFFQICEGPEPKPDEFVHVIEYAAYEQMRQAHEETKRAHAEFCEQAQEKTDADFACVIAANERLDAQLQAAQARAERLVRALEWIHQGASTLTWVQAREIAYAALAEAEARIAELEEAPKFPAYAAIIAERDAMRARVGKLRGALLSVIMCNKCESCSTYSSKIYEETK